MQNKLTPLILSIVVFGCIDEQERKMQLVYNAKIEGMKSEAFRLPDTIDTKLIIASCYSPGNGLQTIFMYRDTLKAIVKKIDFVSDSTSNVEDLQIIKLNEFHSPVLNVDYVIEDKTVSLIHRRNQDGFRTPQSLTLRRTDRD
jgi:hypothetical protein